MVRRRKSSSIEHPLKGVPLIEVTWLDHHANGSWQGDPDHKPAVCFSVGWLWKEDKTGLTLRCSYSPGGGAENGNSQYIIKRCIIGRREIKFQ